MGVLTQLNHCGFDQVMVTHWANCQRRQNVRRRFWIFSDGIEHTLEAHADSVCAVAATSNLMLG